MVKLILALGCCVAAAAQTPDAPPTTGGSGTVVEWHSVVPQEGLLAHRGCDPDHPTAESLCLNSGFMIQTSDFASAWKLFDPDPAYKPLFHISAENGTQIATVEASGKVSVADGWTVEQAFAVTAALAVYEQQRYFAEMERQAHAAEERRGRAVNYLTQLDSTLRVLAGSKKDEPLPPDNDAEHLRALRSARLAWKAALPGVAIPAPKLLIGGAGACDIEEDSIACARHTDKAIIEDDLHGKSYEDLRTIFMHEIAHLLGVPHIEGDRLMDRTYSHPLPQPTPAAVALAKLGLE